jgi:aspartate aminotransferase/aromatic-amino-acid transaminase
MFENLEMAPPDAILGLTEAFKKDANPDKINLGVGVYKDESNATPILQCVKQAEQKVLESEKTKGYLSIWGSNEYGEAVRELIFGAGHEIIKSGRAVTAQTPGGTGGLRVASDFLNKLAPGTAIWLSGPTWANHPAVFNTVDRELKTYPYFDKATNSLDFDATCAALNEVPEGDVVLFHGCCHNPTGIDPTPEQWEKLAAIARERKFLPLIDLAYQGFAAGVEEDVAGVRAFCQPGCELLICSSFSKNFGLYNERVGALTLVSADAEAAEKAFSHLKTCIRSNYSNPPAHGGVIVTTILSDPELRALWDRELATMRDRINSMRSLMVKTLQDKGVTQDFSFIANQNGMFSFSGLNKAQVGRLREEYAIYIVGSGRINVAGLTPNNMDRACEAIAAVLD